MMGEFGLAPAATFDEVLWRIDSQPYDRDSSPTGYVARWTPYLNATTVADKLDGWVGPLGWSDNFTDGPKPGTLWCAITIGEVTKWDLGVSPGGESDLADKGLVSDAFKRCAIIKWGIGRNVYRLENVWAPVKTWTGNDGKVRAKEADESVATIKKMTAHLFAPDE